MEAIYNWMVKKEKLLFTAFLILTIAQLWITKYIPSLDGPQHLHNANMFSNLIKGNELISTFYTTNSTLVGYWTAHFLLTLFTLIFPAWLAEKLFLSFYVLTLVFAFRYLVRSVNKEHENFASLLIFPFVYHMFLLLGYYAFSLAGSLFFFTLGYYLRKENSFKWKAGLFFAVLLALLFLTHGLIYLFFILSFGILFIGTSISRSLEADSRFFRKQFWINAGKLLLAFIPSLILWLIYIKDVISLDSTVAGSALSMKELTKFLLRIRQLVGFHHMREAVAYVPVFAIIFILSVGTIIMLIKKNTGFRALIMNILNRKNVWLIIGTAFLLLYFFAPERISAGSLTNRFGLYFFFMIITWLAMQEHKKILQVLTVFILALSMIHARVIQVEYYIKLNREIDEITELTEHMEENTIVDYRQSSDNWIHPHFQLYAALDKPFVHLRNVQLWGQFPMVWNYESLPRCFAGEKEVRPSGALKVGEDHPAEQIDYFTVFYRERFWNDSTESSWQKILQEDYREIYVSSNKKAALYERKDF